MALPKITRVLIQRAQTDFQTKEPIPRDSYVWKWMNSGTNKYVYSLNKPDLPEKRNQNIISVAYRQQEFFKDLYDKICGKTILPLSEFLTWAALNYSVQRKYGHAHKSPKEKNKAMPIHILRGGPVTKLISLTLQIIRQGHFNKLYLTQEAWIFSIYAEEPNINASRHLLYEYDKEKMGYVEEKNVWDEVISNIDMRNIPKDGSESGLQEEKSALSIH